MDIIDKVLNTVLTPIVNFIGGILIFILSRKWLAILVWILSINLIGIILMKKDKQYAKEDKYRIKESTLLATAAAGGSIGIYLGMRKFRHKTLHKKFTIGVPVIMALQAIFIIYEIIVHIFN